MPINNETLIAVPFNLEYEELRIFLVKLIVQLDIALGYRSGSTDREIATQVVLQEEFDEFKDSLGLGSINALTPFNQVISDPPTQVEVQAVSDNLTLAVSKINEILGVVGLDSSSSTQLSRLL